MVSAVSVFAVLTAAERRVRLGQTGRDGPVAVVPVDDVAHSVAGQVLELLLRHGLVPQAEVVDVPIHCVLPWKQRGWRVLVSLLVFCTEVVS